MKKTLVSALTTALVVGAASTTFAAANPFADVPADHWAYDAVSELQAKGVINGYAVDNTFRGNQNMTRYEMAQIVAKAMAKVSTSGSNVSGADKAMVDKLAAEFKDELANLGVRMDNLEARMDNVKWSGWVRYEYKRMADKSDVGKTAQRIKLRLTPTMKINDKWTAHARLEYSMDANSAHNSTAANWNGGYTGSQFRVDQAWVDTKLGKATVKLGRFGHWDYASHGWAFDDTITGAEVDVPFAEGAWHVNLAAGRYSWYPTDSLAGKTKAAKAVMGSQILTGDPSDGYASGTWTYMGGQVYYTKGKFDAGVGYHYLRSKTATQDQFASMGTKENIQIASVGLGYHFGPVYAIADYSRVNSEINDPNQKNSYNIQLNWQATKMFNFHVAYRRMSNPGTLACTYDLQSYNAKGQKGWEIGTDINLQKNITACAYYFDGKNLDGSAKLKMAYGNLTFKF